MLKIYLVRHGQDEDNRDGILNGHRDTALTPLGLEQARQLALYIKNNRLIFDHIYSSPLKRAYDTARTITLALKMPDPEIFPELIERDFGVMTGRHKDDIEKMCAPDIIKAEEISYFLNPVGGETFPELYERAQRVLSYIEEKYSDGSILLVSHGDLCKMIYAVYHHLTWQEVLPLFHFGNSELILLSPETANFSEAELFDARQYNN